MKELQFRPLQRAAEVPLLHKYACTYGAMPTVRGTCIMSGGGPVTRMHLVYFISSRI